MKPIRPFLFTLIYLTQQIHAQFNFPGVYAGVETMLGASPGSMIRIDHVIWFRPDGSFAADLHKPDWKTAVDGHYTLTGNTVTMLYNKGGKDVCTLRNEMLEVGTSSLLKMPESNRVPPGRYNFTFALSSGVNTGAASVGATANTNIWFDGKGNFTRDETASTQFAGGPVAGGKTQTNSGGGHYSINNGVLTLTYPAGYTETHNFFCSPSDHGSMMAAIDGKIYFTKDPAERKSPAAAAVGNTATNSIGGAKNLLEKANRAQGGTRLDNIHTIRITGTIGGLNFISLMDLRQQRCRFEIYKGSTPIVIQQLEDGAGWQMVNGSRSQLPADQVMELAIGLNTGVMGLRRTNIDRLQPVRQEQKGNTTIITCRLEGTEYAFMFNESSQLIGDGVTFSGKLKTSVYSDLREVDGILLPFKEVIQEGGRQLEVHYSRYELNP